MTTYQTAQSLYSKLFYEVNQTTISQLTEEMCQLVDQLNLTPIEQELFVEIARRYLVCESRLKFRMAKLHERAESQLVQIEMYKENQALHKLVAQLREEKHCQIVTLLNAMRQSHDSTRSATNSSSTNTGLSKTATELSQELFKYVNWNSVPQELIDQLLDLANSQSA